MTEERMICQKITAKHGEVMEERWYPESPAPPKGWRPYCWMNENYDMSKPCDASNTLSIPKKVWMCESCPYRNLEG